MLPVTSTFTGHLAGAEAIYDGPQDNLRRHRDLLRFKRTINPRSTQSLLGMSGSGKSVTVCDLLSQTEGYFGYTSSSLRKGFSDGIYTEML